MESEITVIKPEEFGLEKSQAVTIEEAFKPKIAEREILSSQYGELIKKDITSETCQEATILRRKLVKVRTGISDIHKKQKAFYLAAGKFVDAWKNKETIPVSQMEEGLTNIETHFEKIEEAKRELIRQERSAELEKYETVYGAGDIAMMEDEIYKHFVNGVKTEYEAKKEAERKVESERIAKEKADIAEQKRIRAENEKLKKDAELKRIADEKAEVERQRLAKIEQEKRDKIEREREAKEDAERKERKRKTIIEQNKRDAESREYLAKLQKEHEEKAKLQRELEAKAEAERKQKEAEQLELTRIKDQKEKEQEEARKAELAPDKDKLKKWVDGMLIKGIGVENMSKESIAMANEIFTKFSNFKSWAKGEIEKIK